MITKEHYRAIAEIIKKRWGTQFYSPNGTVGEAARQLEIKYIAANLADYFEQDNPRFDREKFMQACGLEG